jgi:hypothetical protein
MSSGGRQRSMLSGSSCRDCPSVTPITPIQAGSERSQRRAPTERIITSQPSDAWPNLSSIFHPAFFPLPPFFPASVPKYCAFKLRIATPALLAVSALFCSLVNATLRVSVAFHAPEFGILIGESNALLVPGVPVRDGGADGADEGSSMGIGAASCSAQASHGQSAWRWQSKVVVPIVMRVRCSSLCGRDD